MGKTVKSATALIDEMDSLGCLHTPSSDEYPGGNASIWGFARKNSINEALAYRIYNWTADILYRTSGGQWRVDLRNTLMIDLGEDALTDETR